MGLFNTLNEIKDVRKGGNLCDFNGYLEDYIGLLNDQNIINVFEEILKLDNDAHIICNYYSPISKDSISNSIIRYKDIYKLADRAILIPYIIYSKKEDKERMLIISTDNHIYSEAMYYALSEIEGPYKENRNDMISVSLYSTEDVLYAYRNIYVKKIPQLQKEINEKYHKNYDELLSICINLSNDLNNSLTDSIKLSNDKNDTIHSYVRKWFLLKKILYVKYMMDRNMLNNVHNGNMKDQRNKARLNSEMIHFVSISSMWKIN